MKQKIEEKTPLKVLYLEDSPKDVEIIRELLLEAGYDLSLVCTDNKIEFTSLLHKNQYDIILSDFKLPGFDAFGALQLHNEKCPDIPFICVSGSIGEEIAIELIKEGAVDYVLKDRLARLPAAIKHALDEKREKEERKRVDKELQWKTAFLEAQVNSPIDGILVVDNQGNKILQNQRCTYLWKIPQNIVDQNNDAVQVQYVMNRTKYPEQFAEKVKYLYTHPHEISHDEIEFKDGMFLDRYSAPVLGQDGTYYGRIWTFRDITERKQAEDALRALSIRQDAILSAVPDIIMEVDNNKVYNWANNAGLEFFGDDVIGKEASYYFEGDQKTYDMVGSIFKGDEHTIYVESWQRRKDGEKRLLAWWCRVLMDSSGKKNWSFIVSTRYY
jgi:PAS domain-containing protein